MELSESDYRAWLGTFQPGDIVGIGSSPHDCQIASWLKSRGVQVESVGSDTVAVFDWTYGGGEVVYQPLPAWARRHIAAAANRALRADAALRLLDAASV